MALTSRVFKIAATACAAAACLLPLASAQLSGGPRGDRGLILYDGYGYQAGAIEVDGAVPSMSQARFNDKTSSIKVLGGRWEVCTDGGYRGRCEVIRGDVADLRSLGLDNKISSIRPAGRGAGDRPRPGLGGGGGNSGAPIVLYTSEDFRGEALSFDRDERGLGRFNDRARSVRVNDGVWLLCDDVNFGGRCEYVDRDVRDLRQIGLHGRVSSIKLTPYSEGPGSQAITLFQHGDFRGPFLSFDEEVPSLGQYNFSDQVSSIRVSEGRWLICDDANFRGQCEIIRGDVRSLSDIGMNDRISSLRRARPGDRPRGGYGPRAGGNDGYGNGNPRPRGGGYGHGGGSFGNDRGFEGQDTVFFPRPTDRYGDPIRNGSGQATRFCRDMGFRGAEYKGHGSYLVDVLCEK